MIRLLTLFSCLYFLIFSSSAAADLPSKDEMPLFMRGVIVPMITPYKKDLKSIDVNALVAYTKWLNDRSVDLLFPVSGMGQWVELSDDEKRSVIATVLKVAKKPVAPGVTSAAGFAQTIELAKFAEQRGAAAITLALPDFRTKELGNKLYLEYLDFLAKIGSEVSKPILIYDRDGIVSPEMMRDFMKIPTIRGIKHRTSNIISLMRLTAVASPRVAIFAGVEHLTLPAMVVGCAGVVGGGANLFPDYIASIINEYQKGNLHIALARNQKLVDLNDQVSGSREIKTALQMFMGLSLEINNRNSNWQPMSPSELANLKASLKEIGALTK